MRYKHRNSFLTRLAQAASVLCLLCLIFAASGHPVAAAATLKAPSVISATAGEGYCLLVWEPVSGASGYEVWCRTGSGKYKRVAVREGEHVVHYDDKSVKPGKKYSYRILAKGSGAYKDSGRSAAVTLRPCLQTPTILELTESKIKWAKVNGASRYAVYMKTSENGKWKQIGSEKGTSFKIPKKYRSRSAYYTVRACSGDLGSGRDTGFCLKEKKYGKRKILFEGDSITCPEYSWAWRTARLLGLQSTNRAHGRARISATLPEAKWNIYRRSTEKGFKGYDIIVIAAGTNDWGNTVRLGTGKDRDPETFYGAYRAILDRINRDAPHACVILCLPMDRGKFGFSRSDVSGFSFRNPQGDTLEDYRSAVRDLAGQYGCLVYDMARAGVSSRESALKDTIDLLHPNRRTHIRISDDFRKFLVREVLGR